MQCLYSFVLLAIFRAVNRPSFVHLQVQMLALLLVFAIVHSGGAAARRYAEPVIGERAYRVLFAGISLPLAVSTVVRSCLSGNSMALVEGLTCPVRGIPSCTHLWSAPICSAINGLHG